MSPKLVTITSLLVWSTNLDRQLLNNGKVDLKKTSAVKSIQSTFHTSIINIFLLSYLQQNTDIIIVK